MFANPEINRSTPHTPRSQVKSERSPFLDGKKNVEFISPTYSSNIFVNNNPLNNAIDINNDLTNRRSSQNIQNLKNLEKNEELTRAKIDQLSQVIIYDYKTK